MGMKEAKGAKTPLGVQGPQTPDNPSSTSKERTNISIKADTTLQKYK